MGPPALVVIGGLPATGKTAIGRPAAREMRAAYLRIDTIEGAILRGEGRSGLPRGDEGYVIGYELASDQLDLGLDVLVECVTPIAPPRHAWPAVGDRARAPLIERDLVCSDLLAHRRPL